MLKIFTRFCLLLLLAARTATAQIPLETPEKFTGTVLDSSTGAPIPYATVVLLGRDSTVIRAGVTDTEGKFRLSMKSGTAVEKLTVSFVGYQTLVLAAEAEELGVLRLQPQAYAIDGVSVVGARPLVEMERDKIIYNVQSDPIAAGSQLVDVMRRVPLLAVDGEGEVTLAGDEKFTLLVNGRKSEFYVRNLKNILNSLPAAVIKQIEVSTGPSTRYSNSPGNAGTINIVFDRSFSRLFTGSVGMTANTRGNYSPNLFLMGTAGKFTASALVSYADNVVNPFRSTEEFLNTESGTRRLTEMTLHDAKRDRTLPVSLDLVYEIDTCNLLNLTLSYDTHRSGSEVDNLRTDFDAALTETRKYAGSDLLNSKEYSYSGGLLYQHLFSRPDHILSVEYKYADSENRSDQSSAYRGMLDYADRDYRLDRSGTTRQHSASVDYDNTINEKHQIQAGLRYTYRNSMDDNLSASWTDPDTPTRIDGQTDYTQQILFGYARYMITLKNFYAGAGGQFDAMSDRMKNRVDTRRTDNKHNFFNAVPHINVGYSKKGIRFSVWYSQTIERPSSSVLDPFVDDSDPDRVSYGNPDLKSVVTHSIFMNFNIARPKYRFLLMGRHNWSNNDMQTFTALNSAGKYETTYQNIGRYRDSRLMLWTGYYFSQISNIGLELNSSYIDIDPRNGMPARSGFSYGGTISAMVELWKQSYVYAQVGYNENKLTLQSETKGYFDSSISLHQNLFKKKLNIVVTYNNPLHKRLKIKIFTEGIGYSSNLVNLREHIRYVGFRVTYRFGQAQRRRQPTRSSIEDSNDNLIAPEKSKLQQATATDGR